MSLRAATLAASLTSLPFTLPHVLEDFAGGIAGRVGLSTEVGAFLLGGFLALQSLGLVLLARGRRAGWIVTLGVGVVWVAGALVEHGADLARGGLPGGALSTVWLLGLLLTQTAAAVLAGWGLVSEAPSGRGSRG